MTNVQPRMQIMLAARERLPDDAKALFGCMFMASNSEPDICKKLGISDADLQQRKKSLVRILRTVSV